MNDCEERGHYKCHLMAFRTFTDACIHYYLMTTTSRNGLQRETDIADQRSKTELSYPMLLQQFSLEEVPAFSCVSQRVQ